jgi:hypothetical protein
MRSPLNRGGLIGEEKLEDRTRTNGCGEERDQDIGFFLVVCLVYDIRREEWRKFNMFLYNL